jgi:Flp pilus assembly protein TadG
VEFALIAPLLLLLVFGLIQYGFYFWAMQGGSAAAREAARKASVGAPTSCADFRDEVRANIEGIETGGVSITRDFDSTGTVQVGDDVSVTIVFNSHDLNIPFVPFINDGVVTQRATSRVDYVPDTSIGDCS